MSIFRSRFAATLATATASGDAAAESAEAQFRRFLDTIPDAHTGVDADWETAHRRSPARTYAPRRFARDWDRTAAYWSRFGGGWGH